MNRQYYGTQNKVDFRRPNRSFVTAASRSSHEDTQPFHMGHNTNESSPVQESDSEKGGNPPRRRIALACSRCRKRKIKCSGDLGHGQGCQNCKNAGSDSSACQFLRVNSTTAVYAPPPAVPITWTYGQASSSLSSTSGIGQHGGGLSQYSAGIMPAVSYAGSIHPSRMPSLSGPPLTPYTTGPGSQNSASSYKGSLSDDLYDPFYNMQPAQYPGSLQETQDLTASYSSQDTGRTWTPIAPSGKSSFNGSNFVPDSSLRYGTLGLSHMNPSPVTAVSADGNSLFPGMSALAGSLPPSNGDRTLPNPTTKRTSLISNGGVNQGMLGESSSLGLGTNLNYKPNTSWGSISGSSSSGQASSSSTSVSTANITIPTNSKPSTSPKGSQDGTQYGYIPLSRSPPSSLTVARASDYNSAINLPTSSASMENPLGLPEAAFHNGFSSDDLLPSHNSSSSLYSYSIGSGTKSGPLGDSMTSEGQLSNGTQYTALRQPQPQHTSSFDPLRNDSIDASSHAPQRTSISASVRRY